MSHRNPIGVQAGCCPFQEGISDATSGVFDREPFRTGNGLDIDGVHGQRKSVAAGKFPAKRLVAIGRGAQAVVQVRQAGDLKAAVLGQLLEKEGEGDRIRTARQADQHTRAGGKKAVSANGAADLLVKTCHI
jgi:hypothetical protein